MRRIAMTIVAAAGGFLLFVPNAFGSVQAPGAGGGAGSLQAPGAGGGAGSLQAPGAGGGFGSVQAPGAGGGAGLVQAPGAGGGAGNLQAPGAGGGAGVQNLDHRTFSSGAGWGTVAIWTGIGVGIVLVATWLIVEGRRHHWVPPRRPVHTH